MAAAPRPRNKATRIAERILGKGKKRQKDVYSRPDDYR